MSDDWTPEKEEEDDPINLQKEQLALGKEFLERLKKQEAEEKKRREEYVEVPRVYGTAPATYKPPTFEEVSQDAKKAWEEVEKIMPTGTDVAKSRVFESLFHTLISARHPGPVF